MFDESGRLLVNSISDRITDGDGDTYVICGEDYIDFYVAGVELARMNRITGSDVCQFSMIPTTPVPANSEWHGFCIDGDGLDPAGVNAVIRGIDIDFFGISVANLPEIQAIRVSVPVGYTAIHVDEHLHLDMDLSTLVDGVERIGLDIALNEAGATGGLFHAVDVATAGVPTATLVAIGTYTGINVISQNIGAFAAADRGWEYDDSGASYTDRTASFGNVNGNVAIFDDNDDAIYIGDAAVFDEIQVILATPANVDIKPTFWYSQAAAWVQFFPADDTEGFTQSGLIRFDSTALAGFATQAVNGDTQYYIRINRTKNNVTVQPIADNIFILAPTTYYWNALGALGVLSIVTDAAGLTVGATTPSAAQWGYLGAMTAQALENIVEDATPQLGGELDAQAHTIGFTQQTATGDGTTTIDWRLGNKFYFTFGAQNDTFTFTAPTKPCNLILVLKQDGTGSRLATWPGTVLWTAATAPTLSTGIAAVDIVSFYYDGTNYLGVSSLNFN